MAEALGKQMSSDKGYSLVEVLIGLAIFSVGALASAMLITTSLNQNQVAKEKTRISVVVSQRLEELRGRPWSSVAGGPSLQAGGAVLGEGGPSLQAGGAVLGESELRNYSSGTLPADFSETFDYTLEGPAASGSQAPFYLVMWRIEDLTDSGLDFKRITIRGVSMRWNNDESHWLPVASFDHVAMVFREIKAE